MSEPAHVSQVLADYARREPGASDRWTPLTSEPELVLRLCLNYAMREALRLVATPIETLGVVDVGCGIGRSTRAYVDFGCRPQHVTGIDLRPGAIALARELHPTIRWLVYDGAAPLPIDASTGLVSVLTVFSSVAGDAHRSSVARQVIDAAPRGALIFYFDWLRANDFAGRDRLRPERLFADCAVVWHRWFWQHEFLPARHRLRLLWTALTGPDAYRRLRSRLVHRILPSFEVLCCRRG